MKTSHYLIAFLATIALAVTFYALASSHQDAYSAQGKTSGTKDLESERGKSKNPPKGAPWTKSFAEAHQRALLSGKPIFIYSTKTY